MNNNFITNIMPQFLKTFPEFKIIESQAHYIRLFNPTNQIELLVEEIKMTHDDPFSFVKIKSPLTQNNLDYQKSLSFISTMNFCHRGCNWAIDSIAEAENLIYIYSTVVADVRNPQLCFNQFIMEFLTIEKMKLYSDHFLMEYHYNSSWVSHFYDENKNLIIPCLSPENFIQLSEHEVYQSYTQHIKQLGYKIEAINNTSYKLTTSQNNMAILSFAGSELVTVYSIVTENYKGTNDTQAILNERNHDFFMGHFESSPLKNMIGFTNFMRLTPEHNELQMRLFLDSPDFAKTQFQESFQTTHKISA